MFATMLLAALMGCTTHVGAKSTAAADQVTIIRGGSMPMEGMPIQGVTIASGDGLATGRTTYVLGRRFWAVAENDEGMSVVRIRNQAKGGPIAGCVLGTLAFGLLGPWGCLYVSGPTSDIVNIPTPKAE